MALIIGFVAGGLGSLVMWLVVGRKLILKYAGEAVIARITEPDEATIKAMHSMMTLGWNWFLNSKIPTGKKTKTTTDEGEVLETEEEVSPYVMIMRETGRQLTYQLKALKAGYMSQAGRDIAEGLGAEGVPLLGTLGPRKGQTTAEWAFEQLMARAMPTLEQKVNEMLKSKVGASNSTGGW